MVVCSECDRGRTQRRPLHNGRLTMTSANSSARGCELENASLQPPCVLLRLTFCLTTKYTTRAHHTVHIHQPTLVLVWKDPPMVHWSTECV